MIRYAAVFALVASTAAHAQIYECVDANGHKEYSETCPVGTVKENKLMKSGAGATASPPAAGQSTAEQDAAFRKRTMEQQAAQAKAAKQDADDKEAQANCTDARNQLQTVQNGERISRLDANGERVVLDDSARPAEISKLQKAVENWCNKKK